MNNRSFRTKFDIVRSADTPDDLIIEGYFALYEQETELFADCLINIPLQRGKNIIIMEYEPPLVKVGMILSILSLFGLLLWNRYGCKWLLKNYNI